MKTHLLVILIILTIDVTGQVSVNTAGAPPATSSMLDVSSTSLGILIPRMTTAERNAIVTPAVSLMVFNTTTNAYNFWNGTAWVELLAGPMKIVYDGDIDTKIEVEKNPDEDKIRFTTAGYEIAVMDGKTFRLASPGQSVFIGENAGSSDDGTTNQNVFVGYDSGKNNTTGTGNAFIG